MKDANKGRKSEQPEKEIWLSAAQVANILGVSARAVRMGCAAGLYPGSLKTSANGGEGWQVPLACLPGTARAKYFKQREKPKTSKSKSSNVIQQDSVLHSDTAVNQAVREALWERYEKATKGQKESAQRNVEIAHAYLALVREGLTQSRILDELKIQFRKGASKATIWRIQQAIKGQDEDVWTPLLLPAYKGKTHSAPFTEEAWDHIWTDWGRQEKPSLKAVYRRAQKLAPGKGWKIPSYDTVKARIDAMPHAQKVFMREGERALARLYPAQKRIYNMQLHDIWCADGHKADVFVTDETGEIYRPIVMGWMDVRSRVLLGWAVGKSETADLVRRALHQAITRSNAVPREALLDNGRAFASKEISGGAPNRYRFKVKENELLGTLTLLGVGMIWATPGHGQSKPIERYWQLLTDDVAKHPDLTRAYCGNKPDAKPEHFDRKKAVPLAVFKRVLAEAIADKHIRGHRGNAMDGKSPQAVYEKLAQATPIRQPTAAQIRFCLMTAEATRLKGEEGSIQLNGNRYWSEEISGLSRSVTYTVRYNPEDAKAPVSLYLNERFICEVPIFGGVEFRNRDEARKHVKNRKAWAKSVKQADGALARLRKSESGVFRLQAEDPDQGTPAMPRGKIAEPVRLRLQMPVVTKQTEEEDDTPLDISPAQVMEMLARKEASKR